ncbi:ATP-binding protein [Vibrio parahaemolyticus]|nr:ATP-binding protein [Vibrio parahaemolyticus]ELA7174383.1 ATP-binding protein [Vibrio parahaemolyticus]ELA7456959.1 ATP-binding protein [Vibrio parahaemolyticus]ELA7480400.1 ATP-binding protein [Vibrio parahaemolyticus]ELB1569347.1 ATP-binding protein [Vibrio parahaemolyticus]ELK7889333.1 ATP-binding protein [Vibrio parahaemolyticus]
MAEKKLGASKSTVKDKLKSTTKAKAFAEYIWNAIDADATEVDILTELELDPNKIHSITVTDNGTGIKTNNDVTPFDELGNSEKKNSKNPLIRGKHGRGRLSFFKFCDNARWESKHKENSKAVQIEIHEDSLDKFTVTHTEPKLFKNSTGTSVKFNNVHLTPNEFNNTIKTYLINNLTWITLLKPNLKININGARLPLPKYIDHSEINKNVSSHSVDFESIVWESALDLEKSNIYFCDNDNNIIIKQKFNKDSFNCSCIVRSSYFSQFVQKDDGKLVPSFDKSSPIYSEILSIAKEALSTKYLELRKDAVDELIIDYEHKGFFPDSNSTGRLAQFKTEQLKDAIRVIYKADSSVFEGLANDKQKAILIKLIDRIVNSDNPESLFDVLGGVISLSETDMRILSNTLEKVTMSNIVNTINKLEGRIEILELLEALLKNKKDTYEVAHIQKAIESNLWLFGEEFGVVTTEEDKFDKALRNYLKFNEERYDLVDDHDNELYHPKHYDKYEIVHEHKNKEMDVFACQKMPIYIDGKPFFKNLIVELKRPSVKLTDKEVSQIKKYMNVIKNEERFDTKNEYWDFVLVGNVITNKPDNRFDIDTQLDSNKIHGMPGLLLQSGKIRLWIKEWNQVIGDYKLKYFHIIDSLKRKYGEIEETNPDKLTENIKQLASV